VPTLFIRKNPKFHFDVTPMATDKAIEDVCKIAIFHVLGVKNVAAGNMVNNCLQNGSFGHSSN